jgi:hypothetical protein
VVIEGTAARRVTPRDYEAMFRKRLEAPDQLAGVCGRVIRGAKEEEFAKLVFQKGRQLAWVTGPIGLRKMIDLSPSQIVLGIGKTRSWLMEQLDAGMSWGLVVFPDGDCVPATWDGLFQMVRRHYPPDVSDQLARWESRLRDSQHSVVVPPDHTTSKVKDDVQDPWHMSVERYRESADTCENARLFPWHSLGVNDLFTGSGTSPDTGFDEYLRPVCDLSDLPGHVTIPLNVA